MPMEQNSSKTGKAVLLLDDDNHDEEKILEPNGFECESGWQQQREQEGGGGSPSAGQLRFEQMELRTYCYF